MTPDDVSHLRAVGWAAGSRTDHFGSLAKVRGAHYRGRYDDKLFHILATEVIEAMHRASRDTQGLTGTNLDGHAINRPREDARDTVKDLLVGVVLVGRCRQLLPDGDEKLEHRHAAFGIIAREEEPNP